MYGTLYLIPCPISDETSVSDVLPELNKQIIDTLDYFIVENTRSARRFLSKAKIARPIDELLRTQRTRNLSARGRGVGASAA